MKDDDLYIIKSLTQDSKFQRRTVQESVEVEGKNETEQNYAFF